MGTLLGFGDPAPRLRAALRERLGIEVGEDAARAALRAEIAFYRAHLHLGRDAASLAALRERCARRCGPRSARPRRARRSPGSSPRCWTRSPSPRTRTARPRSAPCARRGLRLVVVSNWDASLHERLQETGLAELVDGAVASAELGAAKPDGAMFARGLALAGATAEAAWHVGDSVAADVEGALAAGIRPVLISRDGSAAAPPGVPLIRGLDALPGLIAAGGP